MIGESKLRGESNSAAFEAFDPIAELEQIKKLSRREKQEALEAYKARLFAQKEEIADLEQQLIDAIRKNPDASESDLITLLQGTEAQLSETQKRIFRDAIKEAKERCTILQELRGRFPDDRELFYHLFGFYPAGPIQITLGALNFRVVTYELKDSASITQDAFLERRSPTRGELENAKLTGGKAITYCLAKLPHHSVVVINNSPELKKAIEDSGTEWTHDKLLEHEEQHILNIFFAAERMRKYFDERALDDKEILPVQNWITFYLRMARRYTAEWEYKNEILAFLRMGSTAAFIEEELNLPGYSPGCYRRIITEWLKAGVGKNYGKDAFSKNERFITAVFRQTFGKELRAMIKNGLEAVEILENAGVSRDKLILLLANEPFANWKKFAQRYLEQKNKRLLLRQ